MNIMLNRLQYVLSPQFDVYEQIAERVSGNVADIGCGLGFGCHLLLKRATIVRGYDLDPESVAFAQRTFGFNGLSFAVGDIRQGPMEDFRLSIDQIPQPAPIWDYILMVDVIEHIERDREAVHNAALMLKPGGTFLCSTPNRLTRYRKSDNHVREYCMKEFKILMETSFSNVEICTYDFQPVQNKFGNPLLAVCKKEV